MNNKYLITRELVNLKDLRYNYGKEKKKKGASKPFINKYNKILLPSRDNLVKNIRESNKTKLLIDYEFIP